MSNNKKAANSSKFNRSKSFVSKHAFAPSILPNIVSGGPGIVSPLSVNTGRSRNISTLLLSENLDTQKYTPATITETQNMMYAEVEQCHMGDRFWGLDRDMEDRQNENGAMMLEEKISRKMEFHFLTTAKHRQWDNELQEQKFYRSRVGEHQKDMERQQHMKLLNNPSVSTDELISMIWNNKSDVKTNSHQQLPFHNSISHGEGSMAALSIPAYNPNQSSSISASNNMSVHLDGLQQSKAIVKEAGEAFSSTLKRMNMSSIAAAMNGNSLDANPLATDDEKAKKKHLFQQMQHQLAYSNEIEALMPKHNPAIEGHLEFCWDQELMLQLAFALMDRSKRGCLTMEELSQIAHNVAVHSLLRFTVFWSYIKRKQWSFFLSMFRLISIPNNESINQHNNQHNNNNNNESTTSISSSNALPTENGGSSSSSSDRINYLTYADWMAAAARISRERGVKIRHIRSQDEHAAINSPYLTITPAVISSSTTSAAKDLYISSMNTAKEYLNRQSFERECYMSRKLNVGDNVWGLHNCGVLWLPAVIERIYAPTNTDSHDDDVSNHASNGGDYVVDLWYPLNQRELLKTRSATASRELMQLPSSQRLIIANSNNNNDVSGSREFLADAPVLMYPKPFDSERAACGYAFDLVDSDAKGIVELSKLVRCFCQQREFQTIVDNNSALSIIFSEERRKMFQATTATADSSSEKQRQKISSVKHASRMDNETIPSLLPVFIDTFSVSASEEDNNDNNDESDGKDWISKSDFLEFCQSVVDIKKYSIVASLQDTQDVAIRRENNQVLVQ